MSSFPFSVQPGTEVNQNVGFAPTAVIVNNYTPYYIYFPDALNFCPPWTSGAVIQLAHATQARASWVSTPFGTQLIPAPPAGVTYTATYSFTNDEVGFSGGTAIVNPYALLRTVSGSASGGNGTYVVGAVTGIGTFRGFAVTCVMAGAAANVGYCNFYITSASGTYQIAEGFITPASGMHIQLAYPDPLSIIPIVGAWSVRFGLNDWVGVSQFYATGTLFYS